MTEPRFHVGQIVEHLKAGYRGVVFSVDAEFSLDQEWYDRMAVSEPPKDAPWYHVLVDGASHTTYVAERHLAPARDRSQVSHPLLGELFATYDGEGYQSRPMH